MRISITLFLIVSLKYKNYNAFVFTSFIIVRSRQLFWGRLLTICGFVYKDRSGDSIYKSCCLWNFPVGGAFGVMYSFFFFFFVTVLVRVQRPQRFGTVEGLEMSVLWKNLNSRHQKNAILKEKINDCSFVEILVIFFCFGF